MIVLPTSFNFSVSFATSFHAYFELFSQKIYNQMSVLPFHEFLFMYDFNKDFLEACLVDFKWIIVKKIDGFGFKPKFETKMPPEMRKWSSLHRKFEKITQFQEDFYQKTVNGCVTDRQ